MNIEILEKPESKVMSLNTDEERDIDCKNIDLSSTDWMQDIQPHEQEAIDTILDHLIQTGARPYVEIKGDRLDIITAITKTMRAVVPDHFAAPLKTTNDYIARWICDYFDHTNAGKLHIHFGFNIDTNKGGTA